MNRGKDKPKSDYHISVSAEEEQLLHDNAARAEMKIAPYMRQQALTGAVTTVNWSEIADHTQVVREIASRIQACTCVDNPGREDYGAILEKLIYLLLELRQTESEMVKKVRRSARCGGA